MTAFIRLMQVLRDVLVHFTCVQNKVISGFLENTVHKIIPNRIYSFNVPRTNNPLKMKDICIAHSLPFY